MVSLSCAADPDQRIATLAAQSCFEIPSRAETLWNDS